MLVDLFRLAGHVWTRWAFIAKHHLKMSIGWRNGRGDCWPASSKAFLNNNLFKTGLVNVDASCLVSIAQVRLNASRKDNHITRHADKSFETAVDTETPSSQCTVFNIIELHLKSI